jgi:hypothetical protein
VARVVGACANADRLGARTALVMGTAYLKRRREMVHSRPNHSDPGMQSGVETATRGVGRTPAHGESCGRGRQMSSTTLLRHWQLCSRI